MRVVIAGGSGNLGTLLADHWRARGHDIVVLSRQPKMGPWKSVGWDGKTLDAWTCELEGCDAIVNLAGLSVNCRYTPANRRAILNSRVDSTRVIGEAINLLKSPPRTWLQASTATIYAHRYDRANDETSGLIGGDEPDVPDAWRFSIDVAKAWEHACVAASTPQTRKVLLRTAIVMNTLPGNAFDTLLKLARYGLGGTAGNGRQYVSWIHEYDFVRAIDFLIDRPDLAGAVNVASPNPLPNATFMAELRRAAGVWFGLPAANCMLEAGAFVLGTESELVLKSRRVVPCLLLKAGFEFAFPKWPLAASDLVERMRIAAQIATVAS